MTHSFSLGAIDAHDKTARREPRGHLPRLTNRFLIWGCEADAGSGHGKPEGHRKDNRGDGRVLLGTSCEDHRDAMDDMVEAEQVETSSSQ